MTSARIGALRVDLGANTAAFEKGLTQAERRMNAFKKRVGKIGNQLKTVAKPFAVIGAGLAASATAFAVAANRVSAESRDMANAARVAGEGFEEFQRQAFAAREVGVEFEKLSDIFKDTRERIGEFVVNGGGPLQDAFDALGGKVRLAIEELRGLSGKDALQLIVARMEQAKLSTEEMSFVLESLGSDATALLPLLRDNAKAFDELGSKAAIISEQDQRGLDRYRESQLRFNNAIKELTVTLVNRFLPQFTRAMDLTTRFVRVLSDAVKGMDQTAARLSNLSEGLRIFGNWVSQAWANTTSFLNSIGITAERVQWLAEKIAQAASPLARFVGLLERVGAASNRSNSNGLLPNIGELVGDMRQVASQFATSSQGIQTFTKATRAAGNAARETRDKVADLMEALYPESISRQQIANRDFVEANAERFANPYEARLRALGVGGDPDVQVNSNPEALLDGYVSDTIAPIQDFGPSIGGGQSAVARLEQFNQSIQLIGQTFGSVTQSIANSVSQIIIPAFDESISKANQFAQALNGITNLLQSVFGNKVGGILGAVLQVGAAFGGAGNFGGFRANGGPVQAGKDYWVGERGPELFRASRSGSIVANHHLGGGQMNVTVTMDPSTGKLGAFVRDQAGQVVASAAPAIANAGSELAQGQMSQRAGRRMRR